MARFFGISLSGLSGVFSAARSVAAKRLSASFFGYCLSASRVGFSVMAPPDRWPARLFGSADDLVALGVISLNYGNLENIFRVLFSMVTGMTEFHVAAVFERINNDTRLTAFKQILGGQNYPSDLKNLLSHFIKGYEICAENRHAIMHSHHGGIHRNLAGKDSRGIVLSKYTRAGARVEFFATTAILRSVADAIDQQAMFGAELILTVQSYQICLKQKRLEHFAQKALPKTPLLPTSLNWQSPSIDQYIPRPFEPSPE